MSKKKKDKSEKTSSITHTDLSMSGDPEAIVEALLGDQELEKPLEPAALLRVTAGRLNVDLKKRLGVKISMDDINRVGSHPIVIGPIATDLLYSLACAGSLGSKDNILLSNDRWRELVDVYPDLKGLILEGNDLTYTATHTLTEAAKEESTMTDSLEGAEALEVENDADSIQKDTERKSQLLSNEKRAASATEISKAPVLDQPSKLKELFTTWGLPAIILVFGVSLWLWPKNIDKKQVESIDIPVTEQREVLSSNQIESLPETLRPMPLASLYVSSGALHKKLRPYFESYERGTLYLGQSAIRTITAVASPASASFHLRVMATNMLAVNAISKADYSKARELLQPILIAAPTDVITLLNSAILELASGQLIEAKRYAISAQRLCGSPHCWLAYSLLGKIEAQSGRYREARLLFESAIASNKNILAYGFWMSGLEDAPRSVQGSLDTVLKRALWTDPDRHLDSPLRAPLALHWIYSVASDGWRLASNLFPQNLTPGQRSYIQWLIGSNPFVPLTESLDSVSTTLAQEDQNLSQTLYAYALKEKSQFSRASKVMARTIQLVDFKNTRSSWPWMLAGNIEEELKTIDQATFYYQSALSRNPRDVNAIYGLAMSMRDNNDYNAALGKIAEVMRLDPSYAPAKLKLRRLEWHRKWNYR